MGRRIPTDRPRVERSYIALARFLFWMQTWVHDLVRVRIAGTPRHHGVGQTECVRILEADGCGCAFIDYDNDGWMDIFLLTGIRLDGPPPGWDEATPIS